MTRRAFLRSAGALGLLAAGGCTVGIADPRAFITTSTSTPAPTTTIARRATTSAATTSTASPAPAGVPSSVRVIAPTASIPNLDPLKWAEPDIQRLYRPCVESVFEWSRDGAAVPVLASEPWEMSRDQLVYTVRIRDDVLFHDGSPMDADAVVTSFRAALDPANSSQWSPRLAVALESVESAGTSVVSFRLTRPFSPFETLLGLVPIVPASRAYRPQETYARTLVGTGPFRLESWDDAGVLRYRTFDSYHGRLGEVEELEIWFGDAESAMSELETGSTHLAVGVGPDWKGSPATPAAGSIVRFRALANLDPSRPTSQLEFRRALSAAIDRSRLVAETLGGHGAPMRSILSPSTRFALDDAALEPETGEADPDTDSLSFSIDRPMTVVAVDDPTVRAFASGVQDALSRMGIDSRIEVVQTSGLADVLRLGDPSGSGDFDLLVAGSFAQPLTAFAPDYAYFELRSGLVTNLTKVADPELDQLLEDAVAAPPVERAFRWGAVQRYDVTASLVEIPLAEGRYGEVIGPALRGYQPSPMGTLDALAEI